MCEHTVYWDFNFVYIFVSLYKEWSYHFCLFVISPKDILVAGMKAEIAYKQMTFMSFKNILREGGNEAL